MSLVVKKAWNAECDYCQEQDTSGETGGPWYYDSPAEAMENLAKCGWFVSPDGRLLCAECVENGEELPRLRCTCPAGRGTNPGCPVCP